MRVADQEILGDGPVRRVWAQVMRRAWMIILASLLASLAAALYVLAQPVSYAAATVIQLRGGPDVMDVVQENLFQRRNLAEIAQRQRAFDGMDAVQVPTLLRQAIALEPLSDAGGIAGVTVTVRLNDPDLAVRVANDLGLQVLALDLGGALQPGHRTLNFYRAEEQRLWQEIAGLRAEMALGADDVGRQDGLGEADHSLMLLGDQYDLVRHDLAAAEVAARLEDQTAAGKVSLLQQATPETVQRQVPGNWLWFLVLGGAILALSLAIVTLRRGDWGAAPVVRARLGAAYLVLDDPARPIMGMPRFAVVAALLVAGLLGLSAIIG